MNKETKKQNPLFSPSLFKQSFKSNWFLWLILTLGAAGIFIVINLVVASRKLFTNIDMNSVTTYVKDENLSWLKILGLLEQMGFSLSKIQTMSQIDLNSVVSELIYKITGVLLPMIYVMIVSNSLIAGQVSDGSMAYILSTPTNRRKVVFTQFLFLILSVIAMYVIITISALASQWLGYVIQVQLGTEPSTPVYLFSFLSCFASFCSMVCLAGLCFGASAFFNKANYSVAFGGGICVVSFICCILGLFGNKVFVSVGIGVSAMGIFNFGSVFTLIDTESISEFSKALSGNADAIVSCDWIWKCGILLVIGAIGTLFGSIHFNHKDLPL